MSWVEVLKYQGWRDAKPQPIKNQETKEATIDWIKRNRSVTLKGHERINKQISKINGINAYYIKKYYDNLSKFPLLKPLEPSMEHPLIATDFKGHRNKSFLHPESLVEETSRGIREHNERTIHLLSWLGSSENTHRILTGDLV